MTENGYIQAKYLEGSDEELNRVKRTVTEALKERGSLFDKIKVHENKQLNLRIDVFELK